jgi:ABC-type phosphate transport system substrate-binding protein
MSRTKSICTRIWNRKVLVIAAMPGLLFATVRIARADDLMIVANNGVKAEVISQNELRDVFLGDANSLAGSHVVPVVLQKGPAHDAFLQLVGKSGPVFEATWRKQVFTGKGSMPHACASEDALIAFVGATPGAVGYVSPGKSTAGVKVLKIR